MLKRLHIRNYALIDRAELDFSERLTIITGETGAGKSILLGALGLVMGERADTKIFYNDTEKCVVEAWFDVARYDLKDFFEENELDYDDEVVIRRELSPTGKSRAFVNDTPANNAVLRRLTEVLVDLHQQFDVLDIHEVNFQLRMLDALADNGAALAEYQQGYRQYQADRRLLAELVERSQRSAQEMDFLQFQWEELQQAHLQEGEQEMLEAELSRLTNAEDIKRLYGAAGHYLSEAENSIIGQLQAIARSLNPMRRVSSALDGLSERLENTLTELQEIARDCLRIGEETEYDLARMSEVQERLNVIYRLQKKHGLPDVGALLRLQEDLQRRLGEFTDLGGKISELEQRIAAQEQYLRQLAAQLSERRQSVAAPFEEKVHTLLAQLAMPHARLKVDIQPAEALTPTGTDRVQFLFASNVGSRFLPIKDVASGGELSRLTLCAKSLVADAIPLPTLIFDEIDSGVSGEVSRRMGAILRELSDRHQVISITHTPQIAACADRHYFVYKEVDNGRTVTRLRALAPAERVRAIGVMLSGDPPSEAALATAQELIGSR
jgi:DNA repair protein RecN (Recombination protein N)